MVLEVFRGSEAQNLCQTSVLKVFGSIFVLVLVVFLFVNRSLFFDNLVDEFSDWDGDGISDEQIKISVNFCLSIYSHKSDLSP